MLHFVMVVLVAVLGFAGDLFVSRWAETTQARWLVFSIPAWTLMAIIFGLVLRQKHYSFGVAVVVILLLHSGLALAWDVLVQKAGLSSMQWVGITAALAAIVLIEAGRS